MRIPLVLHLVLVLLPLATPAHPQDRIAMAELDPATARAIRDVVAAADRSFARMPAIRLTGAMPDICGGGAEASLLMRYCTNENAIYVAADLAERVPDRGAASYLMAHMLGHAIQVRHGIADLALAAIRSEPARESELRRMVTLQVECLAGVLMARAGAPDGSLTDWFGAEPFTEPHWGHAPLATAPAVSVGLAARAEWFGRGRDAADVAGCAVGDIPAAPLAEAQR